MPKPPHCDKIFLYFLDRRERQMGKLYFTRHGQTVWNVENKICGTTDVELTELGHEQAKELGREILKRDLGIDEILCSPLIRAKNTAEHIAQMTGLPLRVEPRLMEQNFGKFESTPRDGGFSAGKNAVCQQLRKRRVHAAALPADLQSAG